MFDRQLAKWHLDRQGYLASMDVHLGELGVVDVFGVKLEQTGAAQAVFGVVRGWWHTGAYLTPSLLRNHLQTDRGLMDRIFSPERLQAAAAQFGLADLPEKVLFYSKRSPSLAEQAERELAQLSIRVVYLEDILAQALAEVQPEQLGQGNIFQVLAMVKGSHLFKEMARLARQAEREEQKPTVKPRKRDRQQLDLLDVILAQEDEGDDTP